MMKFVALAVIATVATAAFASQSISIVECQDGECKTGCKAIGKQEAGVCHHRPFSHEGSYEAVCAPAQPGAKCVYGGIFKRNTSSPKDSCVDANVEALRLEQCDTCFLNHRGEHEMISGCDKPGNLSIHLGCNADCSQCKHKYSLPEKQCINPEHFKFSVGYGAPIPCPGRLLVQHYNVSQTCSGPFAPVQITSFQKACYSRGMGRGGRARSHYYICQ